MFITEWVILYVLYTLLFTDNTQIPSELQDTAINLQKTLDWDDKGADGKVYDFTNIYVMIKFQRLYK